VRALEGLRELARLAVSDTPPNLPDRDVGRRKQVGGTRMRTLVRNERTLIPPISGNVRRS
jgi:hypothetical protein